MEKIITLIADFGFPLVFAGVLLWFFISHKNDFKNLIQSAIQRNKSLVAVEGERNELTRNNTAALDNNTAALGLVMSDRDAVIRAIDQHEKSSQERDLRNEELNNNLQRELGKARGEITEVKTIVKERLK